MTNEARAAATAPHPPAAGATRAANGSDAKPDQWSLTVRMMGFLKPVRRTAMIAGAVIAAKTAAEIGSVYFLSPAITAIAGITSARAPASGFGAWLLSPELAGLRRDLLAMGLAQGALAFMSYQRGVWDAKLSMRAVFHIRSAIYDKLQNASFAFHDRMTNGQLINRALSDLQSVRNFVNMGLLGTLDILCAVGGYLALLGFRSPWLAVAALAPLPLWAWVVTRFSRKAQPIFRAQQEASDRLMNALTENVGGVHVVRAFGTEGTEIAKYEACNDGLLARMRDMIRLQSNLVPSLRVIAVAAHIGLFLLSAVLIKAGRMNVGDVMLLGIAMGTILAKLQQANQIAETHQKALVSGRRLFEILDMPPIAVAQGPACDDPAVAGVPASEVAFRGVTFGYDPRRPVLHGIDLLVPAGKTTALVGPTGAGKTTMASLVARFYDAQEGRVSVGGKDVRAWPVDALRRHVGFVFQETFLFTDTIRNNILYGREDVSEEMMRRAARVAQAEEFIMRLPQGYDTPLGDRGVVLSGGQRQRLALARALVYDPSILVLDDATAALDAETDRAVHGMLPGFLEGRTVIIIAHRLSSVRHADQVVVIEDGRIVQRGNHEELMAHDGHYREIVRMQLTEDVTPWMPPQAPAPRGMVVSA